jgi:peptidyl-prolyl cis-trans isomerase SurA
MYMQQMQPALRTYLTKLREDAYIDIKPGFVDSGASPRQTKPVFSAYAPPVPKKKRDKQRFDQRFDRGRSSTVSKTAPTPAATPAVAGAPATSAVAAAPDAATAPAATSPAATTPAATAAVPTGPSTGTAGSKTVASSKPKKIKREKVRFGQAPRNALPPGPQETAEGAGAGVASSTQAANAGDAIAPGTAIAPIDTASTQLADQDPLAPKADNSGKTRYSYRAKTEAADKAAKKQAVVKQKAAYTPVAASTPEQEDRKEQSAPLGLNGDTATKKKAVRAKGAAKERLQNKPTEAPPPPPPPAPTVNPALGTTPQGVTPSPVPVPQTPAPDQQTTPVAPQ